MILFRRRVNYRHYGSPVKTERKVTTISVPWSQVVRWALPVLARVVLFFVALGVLAYFLR